MTYVWGKPQDSALRSKCGVLPIVAYRRDVDKSLKRAAREARQRKKFSVPLEPLAFTGHGQFSGGRKAKKADLSAFGGMIGRECNRKGGTRSLFALNLYITAMIPNEPIADGQA